MTYNELFENIKKKHSFLCVGLDSDIKKIPSHLLKAEDPVYEFNKAIIDATASYAVAYKPNTAFYESRGAEGWRSLEKTVAYIRNNYPDIFVIADAKRGDIGNTSAMYAEAFLETLGCDAVTVAPYMGEDSVAPFFKIKGKWVVVLALTSNKGASDFQMSETSDGKLYEKVIKTSRHWGDSDSLIYVVGATKARMLQDVRKLVPEHFLLVPGVGAQGGSLEEVAEYGMNEKCGLIVNSSRGIIFAETGEGFAEAAAREASEIQRKMKALLEAKNII